MAPNLLEDYGQLAYAQKQGDVIVVVAVSDVAAAQSTCLLQVVLSPEAQIRRNPKGYTISAV